MIDRIQWQSPHLLLMVAITLAVMSALIYWLYRAQVISVPGKLVRILPALRMLSLAVLAMSLLRPVIVNAIPAQQDEMIAVLVDQSQSMSIVDRGRSPAQLVQLAAALGVLQSDIRPSALSELRQYALETHRLVDSVDRAISELDYARLSGRGIETAQEHLTRARIDLSSGMRPLLLMAPDELSQMIARIGSDEIGQREIIERIVAQVDSMQTAADQALYAQNDIVRGICDMLADESRIKLVGRVLGSESSLIRNSPWPVRVFGFSNSCTALQAPFDQLAAEGGETNIDAALSDLRQQTGVKRIAGIVILSDGRNSGATRAKASDWSGTPIFAVAAHGPVGRDVSVSDLTIPSENFVDQTVNIGVELAAVGFEGRDVRVTLDVANQRQTGGATIHDGVGRVNFAVAFHAVGTQPVSAWVQSYPDEATSLNNRIDRTAEVVADRMRVAFLAGNASRDERELREALHADSSLLVREQSTGESPVSLTPDEIARLDVMILMDLPASALSSSQWDAIQQLVARRGGSVIFITVDPTIAASYFENPLAAAMLPSYAQERAVAHVWSGPDAVYRVVPDSNFRPGSFDLAWNDLPAIFQFLSLEPLRPSARALLVERESNLPILSEVRVGQGRAIFLGLDEIWRWEQAQGPLRRDSFWLRLVHSAAHRRGETGNPPPAHQPDQGEMRDITGNDVELTRIVGSRGEIIPLDQVQTLTQRLAGLGDPSPRINERRLWDSPQLFLFVLGCLGLEWAVRKRAGLT